MANPSAMISQLILHSFPLYTLIDYGATHSFIARGVMERQMLEHTIVFDITIKMLDRDKIKSNHMLLGKTMFFRR